MRWFCLLVAVCLASGQTLDERVREVLQSTPGTLRANWGVQIVSLEDGTTLFQTNPAQYFVPASNTKLFTTALALQRLGPDHRFETRIVSEGPPDASGAVRGLSLVGGGDPLLSARKIPYEKGPIEGDPLQAIEQLADQAVAAGLRRVDGDIVGDDTAYIWAPYPPGWAQDDAVWEYGAPVSALSINDNTVTVSFAPKADGPPELVLSPALEYYTFDNRIRMGPAFERKVELERLPGSRQIRLWGAAPPNGLARRRLLVAIDDPALYAAEALAGALRRRGVAIKGRCVARHRYANEVADLKQAEEPARAPEGFVLAKRTSPPLVEALRVIDKVSQNLHAELVLREVARVRRHIGSLEAGREEMREFLKEIGIEETDYRFEDASGLSRLNLVTPDAVVRLLGFMRYSPHWDAWLSLLPQGGEDGTLSDRFERNPLARRIRAKTGSLSHVAALSGYAESSRGLLAFSIMANNYRAPASEIRAVIDKICLLISE